MKGKYGIIDIGSNTIRLVIYERNKAGRLKEIENVKSVARLREYLSDDEILSEEGIQVLLGTLLSFQEITRHHQVNEIKCVATATIRQAKNRQEIIDLIEKATDFQMRILTGFEEAYYGYLAVVNSTSVSEAVTIDIGGGSTELTYFKNRQLIHCHSFAFGALSLKKQFISGNVPTPAELKELSAYILEQFQSLPWLHNKYVPIIAIGGSARNLVQIHQSLKAYPLAGLHQYEMNLNDITRVRRVLSYLTFEQIQKLEGLSKDRADIIIPAVEVFKVLYEVVAARSFILSKKGLRDGLFYEEFNKQFGVPIFPNVLEESFFELAQDYGINLDNVRYVNKLLTQLVEQIRFLNLFPVTNSDICDLKRAAHVYYLGQYIDEESSSQHTFYILANRTIDGLSHRDRLKLALTASYKNKTVFKQYIEPFADWFSSEERKKLRFLGALLRFAFSLNATKRNIVQAINVSEQSGAIMMEIFCKRDWRAEEYQAERHKKHLEKALKRPIILHFQSYKA